MMKVGLVGCGFMGRMHANVYGQLDGAKLVAAAEAKPEVLKRYAADFGVATYSTLEEMLASEALDAVDICLPTYLHKDFTIQAANAGKHVLCEKPMALNLADADAMAEACDRNGVKLMIGHCIRFWPEYAYLKRMVDEGRFGKLLSVHLLRYGEFPSWSSDNWLADSALSGGGVLDMHIHDTDFALYLLGKPDSQSSWGVIDSRGPSHVFTTMTFGSTVAHLEGGWNLPEKTPFKHAFRAIFEDGAAIMDGGPLTIYRNGTDPLVPVFETMKASGGGNISDLGGYFYEIQYFVERVGKGLPLEIVTPQTSRSSLEAVLEEIRQIRANAKAS